MSALTQHPLSAAFPAMSLAELSALTDDVATHGLRQPVVTYQGAVLDGWHRYQACIASKTTPALVEFDGDDPVAFVLSMNLSRRHLSASQRAAAVVSCNEWQPAGRPANKGDPGSSIQTNEQMAVTAEVDVRTVQRAKAAQRGGAGELVRDGKVSAKTGAAIGALPKKERAKAIADPEGWQEQLARKPASPAVPPDDEPADLDASERMADLMADYEAALRIVEADDKLAAAFAELKAERAKYEQLERLYDSQRLELANMTREAKRWKRKADALEKGRAT